MPVLDSVKNLKTGNVPAALDDSETRAMIIILIMILVAALLWASRDQAKQASAQKGGLKLAS